MVSEERELNFYLSRTGVGAIKKVSTIVHPKELENMNFKEMKKAIIESVRPKKILSYCGKSKIFSTSSRQTRTCDFLSATFESSYVIS